MRRVSESDKRWCLGTLTVLVLFLAFLWSCASNPYDGDLRPVAEPDTSSTVTLNIENRRSRDAMDPHIYLLGTGRHDVGVVRGMGGSLHRKIDKSWFGPDGCMTIVAHYVGGRDLVFERFCRSLGDRKIDVALDDLFNPVAAWSHR
jgi:hypothetical protein